MARVQVLVQLDDALLALLDERAAACGTSRSELVRQGVRTILAGDIEAQLDNEIAKGYERLPARCPEAVTELLAVASINEEPW
jgi:metal-responsive CopG/Arc/MetJ family transcriptional regulator